MCMWAVVMRRGIYPSGKYCLDAFAETPNTWKLFVQLSRLDSNRSTPLDEPFSANRTTQPSTFPR